LPVLLTGTTDSRKQFHPFSLNVKYFKAEWLESTNSGWYEGAGIGIPSTDNGLEAVNGVMKKVHSQGHMLSVSQYLENAKKMIRNWSIDRNPVYSSQNVAKPFHDTPCLEDETWKRVWHYLHSCDPALSRSLFKKHSISVW
jgi:hypothetical protein